MDIPVIAAAVLIGAAGGGWLDTVVARSAAAVPLEVIDLDEQPPAPAGATPLDCGVEAPTRRRLRTIPWRQVIVAVLAAAAAVGVAIHGGHSWRVPGQELLVTGLVALAAGDAEWHLLPRRVVWGLLGAVSAATLAAAIGTGQWHHLGAAVLVGAGGFLVFAAISLANPRWMGFGDVRLAAPIGLVVGWAAGAGAALLDLLAINLLASVVGIGLLVTRRATRDSALPYGVFMAAGTIATLLVVR